MQTQKQTAPYVFQEYPKWVTAPDGTRLVVGSESEEKAILGAVPEVQTVTISLDEPDSTMELAASADAPKRRGRPPKVAE